MEVRTMGVNESKYENVILYICDKLGGNVEGKTKLYKLLYFADFDRYELKESRETITGDHFKHLGNGPVPEQCDHIIRGMVSSGKLERTYRDVGHENPMEVFTANVKPDVSVFSAAEQFILNYVIVKYGGLNGTELAQITHGQAPYVTTEMYDTIPFDLALRRGTDFSEVINLPAMKALVLEMAYNRHDIFDDIPIKDRHAEAI
jgi:uncharacterized phage-associated protein